MDFITNTAELLAIYLRSTFVFFLLLIVLSSTGLAQNDENNRYMLGQGFEQAGEFEKAEKIYHDLYTRYPLNPMYLQSLVSVLMTEKKYTIAIDILTAEAVKSPENINHAGMLGRAHYLKGDEKQAFSIWDAFLEKYQAAAYFRGFANYAIEVRAFEKGLQYLYKAKEKSGNNHSVGYEIANLQCLLMNYRAAAKEYVEIILANPDQSAGIEGRMYPYFAKKDALSEFLSVMGEYKHKQNELDQLLARLYFENKDIAEAVRLYKRLDAELGQKGNGLFNFAQQLFHAGYVKEVTEIDAYLLGKYPSSQLTPLFKLQYAKAIEASVNQSADSTKPVWKPVLIHKVHDIEKYRKALDLFAEIVVMFKQSEPAIEARISRGNIFLTAGMLDSALLEFKQVVTLFSMSKFSVIAQMKIAEIAEKQGDFSQALEAYTKVLANNLVKPDEVNTAKYNKALLLVLLQRYEEARDLASQAAEKTADNAANDAIELSILLNTSLNDSSLVLSYVQVIMQCNTGNLKDVDALLLKLSQDKNQFYLKSLAELKRVELFIASDRFGEVITLIDEINTQKSNIFEDKINFYLGQVYRYGLRDVTKAEKSFETFLADYPSSMYCDKVRDEIKRLKTNY